MGQIRDIVKSKTLDPKILHAISEEFLNTGGAKLRRGIGPWGAILTNIAKNKNTQQRTLAGVHTVVSEILVHPNFLLPKEFVSIIASLMTPDLSSALRRNDINRLSQVVKEYDGKRGKHWQMLRIIEAIELNPNFTVKKN